MSPWSIYGAWLAMVVSVTMPPEAARHNDRARVLYEQGERAQALAELTAAYAAMPDVRADRAGRDAVLGSLRGLLLELHAESGEPGFLCDLHGRLERHLRALAAEDTSETLRGYLREVEVKLQAHPPDVCAPPKPVRQSEEQPLRRSAPVAQQAEEVSPKHLRIAGGVFIGLGGVLAGAMSYGLIDQKRLDRRAREIDALAAGRPLMVEEYDRLLDIHGEAVQRRNLAIGAGIASAAAVVFGAVMVARGRTRGRQVALAPWWSSAGAGLTLQVRR